MTELKEQILDLIQGPILMNISTITQDGKPWSRYVVGITMPDMTIMFSTGIGSRKVAQIKNNPEVHVHCGVSDLQTAKAYVQIQGKAEISTDDLIRKQMWSEDLSAYFSGADDPNFCVFMIKPYRIEYMTMSEMVLKVWHP